MNLHIDDNQPVSALQARFSKCFPLLKIELYDEAHHCKEPSASAHQLPPEAKIGAIRKKHTTDDLEIEWGYTTAGVEAGFKEKLGLNVQIFRNENNRWVQTCATDGFTLAQQRDMAIHATRSIFPEFKQQLYEYDRL